MSTYLCMCIFFCNFAVAFGKECAAVDTASLNRQATPASALPTGCTTLAPVGVPVKITNTYILWQRNKDHRQTS